MRRRRTAGGANHRNKIVRKRPLAVRLFADQDRHAPGRAQQRRHHKNSALGCRACLPGDGDMSADARRRGLRDQQDRRARLEQRRLDRGLAVARFIVGRATDDDETGFVALSGDDGRLCADDFAPCRPRARPAPGAPGLERRAQSRRAGFRVRSKRALRSGVITSSVGRKLGSLAGRTWRTPISAARNRPAARSEATSTAPEVSR